MPAVFVSMLRIHRAFFCFFENSHPLSAPRGGLRLPYPCPCYTKKLPSLWGFLAYKGLIRPIKPSYVRGESLGEGPRRQHKRGVPFFSAKMEICCNNTMLAKNDRRKFYKTGAWRHLRKIHLERQPHGSKI